MRTLILTLLISLTLTTPPVAGHAKVHPERLRTTITTLSELPARTSGTPGYEQAAGYIESELHNAGLTTTSHYFKLPVLVVTGAEMQLGGESFPLTPLLNNAITPPAADTAITAPLYYVGQGSYSELDGKNLRDSIVLLRFDSGRNWQTLASIGAKAAIFIDDTSLAANIFYHEKEELTPLNFPCFYMTRDEAEQKFGTLESSGSQPLHPAVTLHAKARWENRVARNIYTFIEGTDESLKNQLLVLEAFIDNEMFVYGRSPGADAASSIATFLELARELAANPRKRSVLLLATGGHALSLTGMREAIWALDSRPKDLKNELQQAADTAARANRNLELLNQLVFPLLADPDRDDRLLEAIRRDLDFAVDQVSRELIRLRMATTDADTTARIQAAAKQRFHLRQLSWATAFDNLPQQQQQLLETVVPQAIARNSRLAEDGARQVTILESAMALHQAVAKYEIAAIVSLHLSSHGNGVGAFHQGWLYNLKSKINRTGAYATIAEVLEQTAGAGSGSAVYHDSLRPSHLRSWESWFFDQPNLGGEVSSLAGFLGLSLVTTGDGRLLWGTPHDTTMRIDWNYLIDQAQLVEKLFVGLADAPALSTGKTPRNGFVTVRARMNLLLQGELFANYPAAQTTVLAYQGMKRYYAMVDEQGYFHIKGLADRKHVADKLIIEGYRFADDGGEIIWAIDKNETGKDNYRLKLLRKSMETDLVMFFCRQTTLFDLLEPRSFNYLTKLQLYDGRRDATPQHYWYSRIDTRESTTTSIYTEPGTMLKLTLSDTVLTNKIILTNGSESKPLGLGYPVNRYPIIPNTLYHGARDIWTLLGPRIDNLERHGIYDSRINALKKRGEEALTQSRDSLAQHVYSTARAKGAEALALAARVYVQVEQTQKDVLFGVLFYIALFVPFAFVSERFIFNFTNIYKRILGFSGILLALIAVVYQVHPAFDLAYSPMVVILAFFILGLSCIVSLIIFFRFEDEMVLLQRRATHKRPEEISRWKAFVAAFFLGVSNLRRRRLRTILTGTTLVILTFTIMSFTTIKSTRSQVRLQLQPSAPYPGILLKNMGHGSLPRQATSILVNSMESIGQPAPRVSLDGPDLSRPLHVPLQRDANTTAVQGIIGLSPEEDQVSGISRVLTAGRWFTKEDHTSVILEEQTAARLGITGAGPHSVELWGAPFRVIGTFKAELLENAVDLDGEPLTPVIFPDEVSTELSDAELEALESGDDVRSFQSRYSHIPAGQVIILPASTLLAAGGSLKSIAFTPPAAAAIPELAKKLTDRFQLAIFTGEKSGAWLYNLSDTVNYSGVPNIIIPLLIAVLIVLNTMISSVYERKSEIAVYTSVGLAPSHVAFLFVAEAIAIGIVAVVLGYLVAQTTAALLSSTPLWSGITVNYSSLSAVGAMILVLLVALLSVTYPARVAARIAMPDVNRTFQLPPPKDNRIHVTLPFLMKYREHESIGGFIYQYLNSHRDISHGIFATGPVEILFSCSTVEQISQMIRAADDPATLHCLHIRTNVWLAPFDFGIMQTVDLQFCPAREGREFLEIKLTLQRRAGELTFWHRLNTNFLHEVRKQLLIWRSLDEKTHRQFEHEFRRTIRGELHSPETV